MTDRTRLFFREIKRIEGADGAAVIVMSDPQCRRALSVVCDSAMTQQVMLREKHVPESSHMLPEVLLEMIFGDGYCASDFEMMVYDVVEGKYLVTLLNKQTLQMRTIRMSDAILLSMLSDIPLYIDEILMRRQYSDYVPNSPGISIPINTIDLDRLNLELAKAIEAEDYRLASHLHEEIQKRNK